MLARLLEYLNNMSCVYTSIADYYDVSAFIVAREYDISAFLIGDASTYFGGGEVDVTFFEGGGGDVNAFIGVDHNK
ncbi:hypothetical protein SK128_026509 [Halocaridina rubra]|uniref:Uncharacterized protein n=1 Tax=Halocaridina rubra TaxID=373956 RepID=A0AAN9A8A6_HALRR